MSKITDQDLHTACANGDGTYSGVKLAQWLVEAVGGKPMSEEDAHALIEDAKARAKAKSRPMKEIPISAAEKIAKDYGYDQVVIYARRVGEEPMPNGEHMTTYGIDKKHCSVAAQIGQTLQRFMGWKA